MWSLLKRNDLTKRIAQFTEELEELRSEKTLLLTRFDYTEDAEMKQAKAWAKLKEKSIDVLIAKEHRCEKELDTALTEFQNLSQKAADYDHDKLWPERLRYRETLSQKTVDQLQTHFGKNFSQRRIHSAEDDVRLYLEDDENTLRQFVKQKRQEKRENMPRKSQDR